MTKLSKLSKINKNVKLPNYVYTNSSIIGKNKTNSFMKRKLSKIWISFKVSSVSGTGLEFEGIIL